MIIIFNMEDIYKNFKNIKKKLKNAVYKAGKITLQKVNTKP